MNGKEVGELLNNVSAAYPNFLKDNKPATVFMFWERALKDFEFERVMDNLVSYSQTNEFPPKIKDLVKGLNVKDPSYNIPGIEETKLIMEKYKPINELTKEKAQAITDSVFGPEWRKNRGRK